MRLERGTWIASTAGVLVAAGVIATFSFGLSDLVMGALARATGMARLLPAVTIGTVRVQSSRWAQDVSVVPPEVRTPLAPAGPVERLQALRARAPVLIETATLIMSAGSTVHLVTPSLTLRDATLVTGGGTLEIETETLDVANSSVRAFAADGPGAAGAGGGHVRIVVHGALRGVLAVDLSGQPGAPGAGGLPGAPGSPGAGGERARSGNTECVTPAGKGSDGKAGGVGGPGSDGSAGGVGGTLDIVAADPVAIVGQIEFTSVGGAGGAPGPGGNGGAGGAAGLGGVPAGVCFGTGPAGRAGARGPAGPAGHVGQLGTDGAMRVHDLASG